MKTQTHDIYVKIEKYLTEEVKTALNQKAYKTTKSKYHEVRFIGTKHTNSQQGYKKLANALNELVGCIMIKGHFVRAVEIKVPHLKEKMFISYIVLSPKEVRYFDEGGIWR